MTRYSYALQITFLLCLSETHGTFFRNSKKKEERILIHLEDDEQLLLPKTYTTVKLIQPIHITDDKFYFDPSEINKKALKYVKHTPVGKLKSSFDLDDQKNCCGKEWLKAEVVPLEELFRPVSLPAAPNHGYPGLDEDDNDEVKPVTEHIEDDIKYDFRTKTHSI